MDDSSREQLLQLVFKSQPDLLDLPVPKVSPNVKRKGHYTLKKFERIERFVEKLSDDLLLDSFEKAVAEITKKCAVPIQRVRAIYHWIKIQDLELISETTESITPRAICPLLFFHFIANGSTSFYSLIFEIMLRILKIPSIRVEGYIKDLYFEPGDHVNRTKHVWNIAYIRDTEGHADWHIFDVATDAENYHGFSYTESRRTSQQSYSVNSEELATGRPRTAGSSRSVFSIRRKRDILRNKRFSYELEDITSSTNSINEADRPLTSPPRTRATIATLNLDIHHLIDDAYFSPAPFDMIKTHFPVDPEYQLLKYPLNIRQFEALPVIRDIFLSLNLALKGASGEPIVKTSNGEVELMFSFKISRLLNFNATLTKWGLMKSYDKGDICYYTKINKKDQSAEVTFIGRLTELGQYRLCVQSAPILIQHYHNVKPKEVAVYKVIWESPASSGKSEMVVPPRHLPIKGCMGFGPHSHFMITNFLLDGDTRIGKLESESGLFDLTFHATKPMAMELEYKIEVEQYNEDWEDLVNIDESLYQLKKDFRNGSINITMTAPGKGEYAMRIYYYSTMNQIWLNICNYLLTALSEYSKGKSSSSVKSAKTFASSFVIPEIVITIYKDDDFPNGGNYMKTVDISEEEEFVDYDDNSSSKNLTLEAPEFKEPHAPEDYMEEKTLVVSAGSPLSDNEEESLLIDMQDQSLSQIEDDETTLPTPQEAVFPVIVFESEQVHEEQEVIVETADTYDEAKCEEFTEDEILAVAENGETEYKLPFKEGKIENAEELLIETEDVKEDQISQTELGDLDLQFNDGKITKQSIEAGFANEEKENQLMKERGSGKEELENTCNQNENLIETEASEVNTEKDSEPEVMNTETPEDAQSQKIQEEDRDVYFNDGRIEERNQTKVDELSDKISSKSTELTPTSPQGEQGEISAEEMNQSEINLGEENSQEEQEAHNDGNNAEKISSVSNSMIDEDSENELKNSVVQEAALILPTEEIKDEMNNLRIVSPIFDKSEYAFEEYLELEKGEENVFPEPTSIKVKEELIELVDHYVHADDVYITEMTSESPVQVPEVLEVTAEESMLSEKSQKSIQSKASPGSLDKESMSSIKEYFLDKTNEHFDDETSDYIASKAPDNIESNSAQNIETELAAYIDDNSIAHVDYNFVAEKFEETVPTDDKDESFGDPIQQTPIRTVSPLSQLSLELWDSCNTLDERQTSQAETKEATEEQKNKYNKINESSAKDDLGSEFFPRHEMNPIVVPIEACHSWGNEETEYIAVEIDKNMSFEPETENADEELVVFQLEVHDDAITSCVPSSSPVFEPEVDIISEDERSVQKSGNLQSSIDSDCDIDTDKNSNANQEETKDSEATTTFSNPVFEAVDTNFEEECEAIALEPEETENAIMDVTSVPSRPSTNVAPTVEVKQQISSSSTTQSRRSTPKSNKSTNNSNKGSRSTSRRSSNVSKNSFHGVTRVVPNPPELEKARRRNSRTSQRSLKIKNSQNASRSEVETTEEKPKLGTANVQNSPPATTIKIDNLNVASISPQESCKMETNLDEQETKHNHGSINSPNETVKSQKEPEIHVSTSKNEKILALEDNWEAKTGNGEGHTNQTSYDIKIKSDVPLTNNDQSYDNLDGENGQSGEAIQKNAQSQSEKEELNQNGIVPILSRVTTYYKDYSQTLETEEMCAELKNSDNRASSSTPTEDKKEFEGHDILLPENKTQEIELEHQGSQSPGDNEDNEETNVDVEDLEISQKNASESPTLLETSQHADSENSNSNETSAKLEGLMLSSMSSKNTSQFMVEETEFTTFRQTVDEVKHQDPSEIESLHIPIEDGHNQKQLRRKRSSVDQDQKILEQIIQNQSHTSANGRLSQKSFSGGTTPRNFESSKQLSSYADTRREIHKTETARKVALKNNESKKQNLREQKSKNKKDFISVISEEDLHSEDTQNEIRKEPCLDEGFESPLLFENSDEETGMLFQLDQAKLLELEEEFEQKKIDEEPSEKICTAKVTKYPQFFTATVFEADENLLEKARFESFGLELNNRSGEPPEEIETISDFDVSYSTAEPAEDSIIQNRPKLFIQEAPSYEIYDKNSSTIIDLDNLERPEAVSLDETFKRGLFKKAFRSPWQFEVSVAVEFEVTDVPDFDKGELTDYRPGKIRKPKKTKKELEKIYGKDKRPQRFRDPNYLSTVEREIPEELKRPLVLTTRFRREMKKLNMQDEESETDKDQEKDACKQHELQSEDNRNKEPHIIGENVGDPTVCESEKVDQIEEKEKRKLLVKLNKVCTQRSLFISQPLPLNKTKAEIFTDPVGKEPMKQEPFNTSAFSRTLTRELKSYRKPGNIIRNILKATFILLGESPLGLDDWDILCGLLNRSFYKDSLTIRMANFSKDDVTDESRDRAFDLMKQIPDEDVERISKPVKVLFDWVKTVL